MWRNFGLKCLNNNKASVCLLWIALCVDKKLCLVGLALSPKCMYCGDWEKSIGHAFFYCNLVAFNQFAHVHDLQAGWKMSLSSRPVPFVTMWCYLLKIMDTLFLCLLVSQSEHNRRNFIKDEKFSFQLIMFFKHLLR